VANHRKAVLAKDRITAKMSEDKNHLAEMERIEEIMVPLDQYPSVTPDTTIRDAIIAINDASIQTHVCLSLPRSLLVIDDHHHLKGTLRRRDILRGLEPKFLQGESLYYRKKLFDVHIDPNLSELSWDKTMREMRTQANRLVSEIMLPADVTINYDEHILKAVYEMTSYERSLLPVLKDKKVIGVVRSVDVFLTMAKYIL
jgi:predicted transcriptional regulator